ncbi:nitroreductase [Orbus hercynius]|uniref:Nitroreductase n=1 Tax=Orbus hercynius TaxID=593135 RepID=A0A495RI65_9GAMM|nr:NAD(P)H-dependent oxidoreductase [Orbus hercynius]RKS87049.1 nitroreductase [Orbus hercynius]
MDKLTQAFNFRHACKVFDEAKKISAQDIDYILEAGRTSPSSFGMEPWHFVVTTNDSLKEKLKTACYNQQQVTTCSHFIVVLYRKSTQFTMQSEYLRQTVQRSLPTDGASFDLDAACQYFINYCNNGLSHGVSVDNWSEMQCYIPCANMMTAAAYRQIDSCAIGGFQADKLLAELAKASPQINEHNFGIALCLAFGYRKNPQSTQFRWSKEEITTYL